MLATEILQYALEKDRTVTCNVLTNRIVLEHADGSRFSIENALHEIRHDDDIDWLIVFAEHFLPMVFAVEDLRQYQIFDEQGTCVKSWEEE